MTDNVMYLDKNRQISKQPRPEWANDPKLQLTKDAITKFEETPLEIPPRLKFEGNILDADIVPRGDGDLIYHFSNIKHPDFKKILAEVVEQHFGATDDFRIDFVPELQAWGLLAKNVRKKPLFNLMFYTEDFLWLLDAVLKEA